MEPRRVSDRFLPDILISTVSARSVWAVVGDWEAGRFLLPEIDLCGSPLTLASGNLDHAEDPVVHYDILPHQVGGVGALSEGRVATCSRSNPARPGRETSEGRRSTQVGCLGWA